MIEKLNRIKNLIKNFLPCSSKVAVHSAVVSFLIALTSSLLCYTLFMGGTQPYHDIAAGNITLPGVYKSIDFFTYYTFIVVYLIMFLLFNRVFNNKMKLVNEIAIVVNPIHFILGMLPAFLMLLFKMGTVPIFNLCFCLYLVAVISGLSYAKMKKENIAKLATSCFYVYLSSAGVLAFTAYFSPNVAVVGTKYFIPLLWILLCVVAIVIYLFAKGKFIRYEDITVDLISAITQLIIPLSLFSLINVRYFYQGAEYFPVYYSRFKKMIVALIVLLCVMNMVNLVRVILKKRKMTCVSMSTVVSFIAVCFWDSGYNLIINTDQFHTGETAIVYQQIIEKGQKWGSEFVSVLQGLGFSLSWINELVFGGRYSTYTQAQNLLLVFMAVITALLLFSIIDHKYLILLFAPVMPLFYMNRIFLIAPVFLFLLNPRIIKNPFKWTYCYIVTCIIHVWYQPTYGGAVAASLIPVFLLIWYKAYKNNTIIDLHNGKSRLKIAAFIFSVVAIGICCIPLLLYAIHFLKTNAYETLIGNGVSVSQTMAYAPNTITGFTFFDSIIQFIFKFGSGLVAFIIMLYIFVRYVVRQKDEIKLIQGVILTVSAVIAYLLMLPSILTRIDPGISRIGGTSFIFFGLLLMLLLYLYRNEIKLKPIAVFLCGVSLSACFYVTYPPYLQIHQKVNSIVSIPDDAIYAKPEETGLLNLGYAFIQNEQYLNEAMVINEMCNYLLTDNQTYYDFTDKSIYYLLTDNKVPGLYVSSMVASNEILQKESIERLKENDVPLIFVNIPLRYTGLSESLRSYRIYRYFMEQDYKFVRYKGCNFLVRNDIDLSPIQDNIEVVDLSNQIGIYDDLIDEASYNGSMLNELAKDNISVANNINITDKNMYIGGTDPFLVFKSDKQIDFSNIQLVEISLKNKPLVDMNGQLFVETEKIGHNETNTIHFDIKTNRVLIPLYNYEQFKLDSKLVNLRLDFDNVSEGTDVTIDSIKLYSLNDGQRANLTQQFKEITSKKSDNRLDDLFHQKNLMFLPREWGNSFNRMKERFTGSEIAQSDQEQLQVADDSVSVHFNMSKKIAGYDGEFLRLKLECGNNKQRNAILIVRGIDKNGNNFEEEFQFIADSGNLLIPIASSPNCLQAKELSNFDVIFSPSEESYEVKMEEAQMYKLTK